MSFCDAGIPPMGQEGLRRLQDRFLLKRIPAVGSLELTRRCNLRCLHCYAGPAEPGTHPEQNTGQWHRVVEQIAAAGCLTLLITGGEPLLRPDFPDIYRKAKELGMLVTVFSNGTLIGPGITSLFQEWPPEEVEITLLGATAETHDRLTGVPGSFHRVQSGLHALLDAGIRTALKAMIMKPNQAELEAMEGLALELWRLLPHRRVAVPPLRWRSSPPGIPPVATRGGGSRSGQSGAAEALAKRRGRVARSPRPGGRPPVPVRGRPIQLPHRSGREPDPLPDAPGAVIRPGPGIVHGGLGLPGEAAGTRGAGGLPLPGVHSRPGLRSLSGPVAAGNRVVVPTAQFLL